MISETNFETLETHVTRIKLPSMYLQPQCIIPTFSLFVIYVIHNCKGVIQTLKTAFMKTWILLSDAIFYNGVTAHQYYRFLTDFLQISSVLLDVMHRDLVIDFCFLFFS